MSRLSGWWIRLRRALNPRAFDRQMAAEMRAHLDAETCRRVEQGEDPVTARRRNGIRDLQAEEKDFENHLRRNSLAMSRSASRRRASSRLS